jgi:long-chain acyl-CoA synthetase
MPALQHTFKRRRIMLTGATGFLGKVFLYLLLRWHPELDRIHLLIRGDRRTSLNRMRREILDSPVMGPLREHLGGRFDACVEEKIAVVPGDITVPGLVTGGADPIARGTLDAVVHCAGLVNFEASLEKALSINTLGVANVLDYARKHRAALMHLSTCYVAGAADGHRFEDDIPHDWCPNGMPGFLVEREVRDARAAIERAEAESRDQVREAEFAGDGAADAASREGHAGAPGEHRRKRWVERRLKEIGRARAESWGWPNTYSYTKSLGEQLVLAERGRTPVAVVRPAVIESALRDPFPGWNQGVNTSAPLSYLSGRGYRFYPARGDLVLDVIPVDLAAHAMVPILAALLLGRHQPVYQLCTSDLNPFPMRRLVELTALSNRREHRRQGGAAAKLAPHIEAVVVSKPTYDLVSDTLPRILKHAASFAQSVLGPESERARRFSTLVDRVKENTDLARELVAVYRPYIHELIYTFHGKNIRALYAALRPEDAARHPFAPGEIDWADYWMNVHLPGLRRHIFPQLDLHTRGRPHLLPRFRSLIDLLERVAERHGARAALVAHRPSGHRTALSYRELRDGARRGALLLAGRGVKPGDRVLLLGENSPEWVLGFFAILYAGAIAVPLDHLISAGELAPIFKIAEPTTMVRSAGVAARLGERMREMAPGMVEVDFAELTRPFILSKAAAIPAEPERKSLASIVFTSGTTGAPKGVMLSHGNFAAEVAMLGRVFTLKTDDVVLSVLPLHHTFEFTCGMLLPLASGAAITYPAAVDAKSIPRVLADVRPTALIGVPALWEAIHRRIVEEAEARGPLFHAAFDELRQLNRRLDRDYRMNLGSILFRPAHAALGGRLRLAVSGGAALPRRVAEFFNDLGVSILKGYGLTEAAPVISVAHPGEKPVAGSVGKPLARLDVKLAGGGEIGEILVRGPNVMEGYYRSPAATAAMLKDGWLHTGDVGRFDAGGRLYIVGRAKDVIVDAGGNTTYIDELEELYSHHRDIKEMAVLGLKVGDGEQPAALVVPTYSRGMSRRVVEERLRAHFDEVGARLSPHKRIRILRFIERDLPRTRTRKIKRAETRAILGGMLESGGGHSARPGAEVEPWLAEAIAQVSSEPVPVTLATRLIEDLGLDSLALTELGEHIGRRLGRDIGSEELSILATVNDLQRLAESSEAAAPAEMPSYARFAEPYTASLPKPLQGLGRALVRAGERAIMQSWLRPTIIGRGNVPANSNVLVVANHASHFDFAVIGHALGPTGKRLIVLAAKDYFFNTPARRFLVSNLTTLVPFDRERARLESLDEALAELEAGRSVLMFPEGTRSSDGAMQEFKSGVGYLALRGGCDVLPVHISGTHDVLGKGQLVPRRHPVEVRIGRPIANAKLREAAQSSQGAGAYRKVAEFLQSAVAALAEPPRRAARTTASDHGHSAPSGQAPRSGERCAPARRRARR